MHILTFSKSGSLRLLRPDNLEIEDDTIRLPKTLFFPACLNHSLFTNTTYLMNKQGVVRVKFAKGKAENEIYFNYFCNLPLCPTQTGEHYSLSV